ncbi:NagC/XylR-type transciptional regulator [Bifidobacterium goeldii]|uniref:NagC/XylR-type transciptional regulator n=1 Tax=Bifidobacterium goeldii TaxID=2306975 RepID=A0A430FKE7_9BIFI|nr:ROK family transcriptional regulator [Bifidobacterium goeldii]RSX53307.1 NagC/XylR-type transciptional regulator [Bifidobacterium goeldii]
MQKDMQSNLFDASAGGRIGVLPNNVLAKVNSSAIRAANRALVLRALFPRETKSRAEIARETGLTRVTTSEVVATLIEDGLVLETGVRDSGNRGKKGISLRIDPDSRHMVVIDLSQPDAIVGAVTNLIGQVVYRKEEPFRFDKSLETDTVVNMIEMLVDAATSPVLAVGIASPGVVSDSGVVIRSTSLGWSNVDIAHIVRQRFPVHVYVHNDANGAALAEEQFGGGGSDLIVIHVARGLGAGVMVNNQLVHGSNYSGGEIGHVVIRPDGKTCRCGKRGCLETCVSSSVIDQCMAEDPARRRDILHEAGVMMGNALSMPVGMLDIPRVVFYGPSSIVNDTFIGAVGATINDAVVTGFRTKVNVSISRLGDDIVVKGETAAILRNELGI